MEPTQPIKELVSSSNEQTKDNSPTNQLSGLQDCAQDMTVVVNPDDPESYYKRGIEKSDRGDYEAAIKDFDKAIMLSPDHYEAYYKRGIALSNLYYYEEAFRSFDKARELIIQLKGEENVELSSIYNDLGKIFINRGDYSRAMDYYQKALQIRERVLDENNPVIATSFYNIGKLYRVMGDYSRAMMYYQKALAIRERVFGAQSPATAASLNNIGGLYRVMGDYSRAMESYRKALEIWERELGGESPGIVTCYSNIGELYRVMNDFPQALEYYKKAFEKSEQLFGAEDPLTLSIKKAVEELQTKTGYIQTIFYKPSEAVRVYTEYHSNLVNHIKVLIDFNWLPISEDSSAEIFGKLLISERVLSVLCKNLDVDNRENVSNIAQGIKRVFRNKYPEGLQDHGTVILEPQIEINDPSGDGVFCYVKLGHDAYEAANRQ